MVVACVAENVIGSFKVAMHLRDTEVDLAVGQRDNLIADGIHSSISLRIGIARVPVGLGLGVVDTETDSLGPNFVVLFIDDHNLVFRKACEPNTSVKHVLRSMQLKTLPLSIWPSVESKSLKAEHLVGLAVGDSAVLKEATVFGILADVASVGDSDSAQNVEIACCNATSVKFACKTHRLQLRPFFLRNGELANSFGLGVLWRLNWLSMTIYLFRR